MNEPAEADTLAQQPTLVKAFDYGIVAGGGAALAYGLLAEPVRLTWGLIAVGFVGGIVIGAAVERGAWGRRPHVTLRRLKALAGAIALGSWIVGLFIAYFVSQALIPQAATPLLERVSFAGFSEYFAGLFEQIRVIHAASVAAMVFAAWRWAR